MGKFSLASLTKENTKKGRGIVVHGTGGVGKSTLAVDACLAENGIMILGEDGISEMGTDVTRTPLVKSWTEFQDIIVAIAKEDHDYSVVAIDTIDSLVSMLDDYVVTEYYGGDVKSANAYKAKYSEMKTEFIKLLNALEAIKNRNIDVVIICHSIIDTCRNPDDEAFQRWGLNLPGGAKTSLASLLYDWSDYCFFARRDVTVTDGRASGERRVLMTQWNAAWDAKSRKEVPNKILLSWESLKGALN